MCRKISGVLVCGIGTNSGECPTQVGGKQLKEYKLWQDMLLRCTEKYWKKHPTYTGVACSENFKSYTFFYEWCNQQIGFSNRDNKNRSWCLDKDLLVKGNKIYSEDTCVFVPERLNLLLVKGDAVRGEHPIGVSWDEANSKFMSRYVEYCGKQKNLGRFNTAQEAFQAYKFNKEALIKQVTDDYKASIDPRAYQALLNYTVEITD